MMLKKNIFSKKYPLFDKYIKDETLRTNMCKNEDLARKYKDYEFTIEIFIKTLERIFDVETISKFIIDVILKLPDNVMVSFITAYLNSKDPDKAKSDVLVYYNKTAAFGNDAVKYMEENGIVTNRSYVEIKDKARIARLKSDSEQELKLIDELNKEYNSLTNGTEQYNEELLSDIYPKLNVEEKMFVNSLLKENMFNPLSVIFERFNYNLYTIIQLLMKNNITTNILNLKVYRNFNDYEMMIFIFLLLSYDSKEIIENTKLLIDNDKISVVKRAVLEDNLQYLDKLDKDEIASLPVEILLNKLSLIGLSEERRKVREVLA